MLDRFKGCRIKVAYEAGPCGFWLHDKLTEDGKEVIVVPPSLIPVESGNKVKTDKRDSRKLARLLGEVANFYYQPASKNWGKEIRLVLPESFV